MLPIGWGTGRRMRTDMLQYILGRTVGDGMGYDQRTQRGVSLYPHGTTMEYLARRGLRAGRMEIVCRRGDIASWTTERVTDENHRQRIPRECRRTPSQERSSAPRK